jgi:hypothetical protein
MVVRGGFLPLSGGGDRGGWMDRVVCFAHGWARGSDGPDDAFLFLGSHDVGARIGKRSSAARIGTPRPATRIRVGHGGNRIVALVLDADGRCCQRPAHGAKLRHGVSGHGRAVVPSLWSGGAEHGVGDVLAGGDRAGDVALAGGSDLEFYGQLAGGTGGAVCGDGDSVGDSYLGVVGRKNQFTTETQRHRGMPKKFLAGWVFLCVSVPLWWVAFVSWNRIQLRGERLSHPYFGPVSGGPSKRFPRDFVRRAWHDREPGRRR